MPIPFKVTEYGCAFKCGHKHSKNIDGMAKHEARCWYNPEVRACKTCKHYDRYIDSDDYTSWFAEGCNVVDEFNNEDFKIHTNCEHWEAKNESFV
jgi:hypothetical protein